MRAKLAMAVITACCLKADQSNQEGFRVSKNTERGPGGSISRVATVEPIKSRTEVKQEPYGRMPDGSTIDRYTLKKGRLDATIITYGGIIVSLNTPDRAGKLGDVVLGYDSLADYVRNDQYFGAIIGRYANRIAHARFSLDGTEYKLAQNDGENSLHGGAHGFDTVVWQGRAIADGVELSYVSRDGEEGYPGTLSVRVRYTLSTACLRVEYSATTDKKTIINLTNHSYFNLAGQGRGEILHHQLKINASRFTPVDSSLIPTGSLASVNSTPFDFRKAREIGASIDADNEQLRWGRGYDHNWVLDGARGQLIEAAEVFEPISGRALEVFTDQPAIQFYSGNFLDGSVVGKGHRVYPKRSAFCLETQHFPDSPHHPNFPPVELRPGEHYHTTTIYKFSTRGASPGSVVTDQE